MKFNMYFVRYSRVFLIKGPILFVPSAAIFNKFHCERHTGCNKKALQIKKKIYYKRTNDDDDDDEFAVFTNGIREMSFFFSNYKKKSQIQKLPIESA